MLLSCGCIHSHSVGIAIAHFYPLCCSWQAAFGTCSEPSRLVNDGKTWSTRVDISHLQPYMQAGMPTRFSLANVLSNTYNVPIWAHVQLDVYFKGPQPSTSTTPQLQRHQQHHVVRRALHGSVTPQAPALARFPLSMSDEPSVPDEVMPLVPSGQTSMEALSVVSGYGDRCVMHLLEMLQHLAPCCKDGQPDAARILAAPLDQHKSIRPITSLRE